MVGVMVLGIVHRPGMPGLDFRVGDLQFRLTPGPQCLQYDRVCFLGDQPLDSTAVRPIEKREPREVANRIWKTVYLKQCLWPVEVILTHLAQGEIRLVDLLVEMQRSGGEGNHILYVVAGEIAPVVPIHPDLARGKGLAGLGFESSPTPCSGGLSKLIDFGVGKSGCGFSCRQE